jgi:hypothetical protein
MSCTAVSVSTFYPFLFHIRRERKKEIENIKRQIADLKEDIKSHQSQSRIRNGLKNLANMTISNKCSEDIDVATFVGIMQSLPDSGNVSEEKYTELQTAFRDK